MSGRISIARDGFSLSALATGQQDGPTILLSNSLGAGLGMWAPQRAFLENHYRVIGYDTRGHGQSGTPAGDYNFDDLTGDAIAVLDHFGVETADYVGLSLGGMTGLGLALDHNKRFGKIVCACARADAPPPFATSWDDRIAGISNGGMSAIWPGTLEKWLTQSFIMQNDDTVDALGNDFTSTTVAGYTGCARALQTLDYLNRLGDVDMPVLFISGEDDLGAAPAVMQNMAGTTPNSSYVNIPDCAHVANLNQPDAFNRAIADFLEV